MMSDNLSSNSSTTGLQKKKKQKKPLERSLKTAASAVPQRGHSRGVEPPKSSNQVPIAVVATSPQGHTSNPGCATPSIWAKIHIIDFSAKDDDADDDVQRADSFGQKYEGKNYDRCWQPDLPNGQQQVKPRQTKLLLLFVRKGKKNKNKNKTSIKRSPWEFSAGPKCSSRQLV